MPINPISCIYKSKYFLVSSLIVRFSSFAAFIILSSISVIFETYVTFGYMPFKTFDNKSADIKALALPIWILLYTVGPQE